MRINYLDGNERHSWDSYVLSHPAANPYHLSGWQAVVEKTYGLKTTYLMAIKDKDELVCGNSQRDKINLLSTSYSEANRSFIAGILPLVHLRVSLVCNSLISLPFFDCGGILADDANTEKELLLAALKVGYELKIKRIELRQLQPLSLLTEANSSSNLIRTPMSHQPSPVRWACQTYSHKVRMLLDLPESSEVLMKSFKAKLRSQINKPLKEGLRAKVGGLELLEDFYRVFSINMRDLGSPVHSKKLMRNVLQEFTEEAKIVVVYKDVQPLACSLVVGFKNTLVNPWASALRKYSRLSPNMLLYWTMLEYGCDNGYASFDFGRSSPDAGTYRFKKQWGARPTPSYWHFISADGRPMDLHFSEKSKFDKAIQYWQKLPLPITKIIGPMIRKHIGL